MPSTSWKQHKLMLAACHSKDFADKIGIKQEQACEFVQADKEAGLWQNEPKGNSTDKKGKKKVSKESFFIDWSHD